MSISDQLPYTTVRIEGVSEDGGVFTGSGFYFHYEFTDELQVPVIVTNKHVVCDAKIGKIYITAANQENMPVHGSHMMFLIEDMASKCIPHPDPNIDLAIYPVGNLFGMKAATGEKPFYKALTEATLPSEEFISEMKAIEDILMVGYPNGLWDSKNNMPIVRKGITATSYSIEYENEPKFIIDAACFPGSSGSPVFGLNKGSYQDKHGTTHIGVGTDRFALLGILYAGPKFSATGCIDIVEIPTKQVAVFKPDIMMNLGYCIKSRKLLDFKPMLQALIGN